MGSEFSWIPFYMEFADKLHVYKERRGELVDIIKDVYKNTGIKLPTLDKDGAVFDIDPFTVFGLFNKGITKTNRIRIAESFKRILSISADVPSDFDGIPVLNNQKATFYWFEDDREEHDIDNLWEMFTSALDYSKDQSENNRVIFCKWYEIVIKQKGVRWNLSIGLYWIRPYTYLNLDSQNRDYLKNSLDLSDELRKAFKEKAKAVPNANDYLTLCDMCLAEITSNEKEYDSFPSFSHYVWLSSKEDDDKGNDNDWYPSLDSYTPGLTVENWTALLQDSTVFDQNSLLVIQRLFDMGGEATCKQLSEKYGESINYYNRGLSSLAKRVYDKTNCTLPPNEKGSVWWPIVCFQKKLNNNSQGTWLIKLRNELETAYRKMNQVESTSILYTKKQFLTDVFITEQEYDKLRALLLRKKNIILQGAPGVGKTFSAKRLAYSIIGEKNESRICMVQFHQSYSYEDFIFGYRPNEDGDFKPCSGVFYDFCEKCKADPNNEYFFIIDEINRGNLSKIFGELLMLIETDKRGEDNKINLVYGGKQFYIPEKLYIIGLMNTADRSLAMIDYALRRRFSFYTMKPAFDNADTNGFGDHIKGLDCPLYHSVIDKVKNMNLAIRKDTSLGKGFEIGHSYFISAKNDVVNDEWVRGVVEYEIIPLIEEYWFDDDKTADRWISEFRQIIGENDDD